MDIDSDTSEGRRQSELADDALFACINSSIARQNRHPSFSNVPDDLYEKAEAHQDQLTDQERQLLLSRGDLVGKVLGNPDSLTHDEIHEFLLWPAPDVVRTNIQNATVGTCSTPTELFAKFKTILDRGEKLETVASDAELVLPARQFHDLKDETYQDTASLAMASLKGHDSATKLLFSRLELDGQVLQASCMYYLQRGNVKNASMTTAMQEAVNVVSPEVNMRLIRMGEPINKHIKGELSDAEFANSMQEHIAGLKTAAGPSPNRYAPLRDLIDNLTTIWQEQEQGAVMVPLQETLGRHAQAMGAFDDARFGGIYRDENARFMAKERAWTNDLFGTGEWPPGYSWQKITPVKLFREAMPSLKGLAIQRTWRALPEEDKAPYRTQSEGMRLAAWESHRSNPVPPPSYAPPPNEGYCPPNSQGRQQQQPGYESRPMRQPWRPPPMIMTDLILFRDECYPGMNIMDALARLQALSPAERREYGRRAEQMNEAANAAQREATRERLRNGGGLFG